MRLKLKEVAEEDRIRNWTSVGLAEFVEVLRENHKDLTSLGDAVIHQGKSSTPT
ncbi:hypothetical protein R9C00_20985 [Flammeovirgaceae bacterium SG7u.111]|nr:hypothetical protein [Flammeovirgaceae bacterium SG7u.132]WPO34177.1 hypothetical protein R9C00_20985 [Flammeovirgaceae bacterium SG7u.111]